MSYRQRNIKMQKIICLSAAILLFITPAWSFCQTSPRLICAEYSNTELVVIAKLTNTRYVANQNDVDLNIYTLNAERTLRGAVSSIFRVREENSSGRSSFKWERGRSYLLFLNRNKDGTWSLYGCGNSGPMSEAGYALKVIESLKTRQGGLIQGVVLGDQPPASRAEIRILIHGVARDYVTMTDKAGEFKTHVLAGKYEIHPVQAGAFFQTSVYSNEDPREVTIENGGCVQVTFERTN
jgi:hypothetical protein